jgi:hypothetical protein
MRILVAVVLGVLLTLVALVLVYRCVEKVDDGYIISTGNSVFDPIGELKLAYTRATRDCSAVQKMGQAEMLAALAKSNLQIKSAEANPKPRAGSKQGAWMLVETDFENLEPAVILLESTANTYKVASVYGGTAAPYNDVQVIHSHLSHQAREAPQQLINCYEPAGPPFDRAP